MSPGEGSHAPQLSAHREGELSVGGGGPGFSKVVTVSLTPPLTYLGPQLGDVPARVISYSSRYHGDAEVEGVGGHTERARWILVSLPVCAHLART